MLNMRIVDYCVGDVQTNCYIGINETTREAFVVDPGDSAEILAKEIRELKVKPTAILLTHGHFDHAGAAKKLAEMLKVKIYAHEAEQETLEKPCYNLSDMVGKSDKYHADVYVREGQQLDIAGFSMQVFHIPGHTAGGCCYYIPKEDVLFSGDTLFCQSIGRTDFPGGSMSQLVHAIQDKLLVLPENTEVYPGHMDSTTIGQERMWNPYL